MAAVGPGPPHRVAGLDGDVCGNEFDASLSDIVNGAADSEIETGREGARDMAEHRGILLGCIYHDMSGDRRAIQENGPKNSLLKNSMN